MITLQRNAIHPSICLSVLQQFHYQLVWGEDCCLVFDLGFSSSSSRLVCISKPPARALPALPDLSQCIRRVHSLLCPSCNLLLIFVSEGGWWCSMVSSPQIKFVFGWFVILSYKMTQTNLLSCWQHWCLEFLENLDSLSLYDCASHVITHPAILSPDHPCIQSVWFLLQKHL